MIKNHGKYNLKDIILGGQDGLVNVLGIVLAVASATLDTRVIIISGIAALVAESLSMGAVAYTSSKAARDYYKSVASSSKLPKEYKSSLKSGMVVGFSSVIGSIIPILPFFFLQVTSGVIASFFLSIALLFCLGSVKALVTRGVWYKSGFEIMLIGLSAAILGYLVGKLLGVLPL